MFFIYLLLQNFSATNSFNLSLWIFKSVAGECVQWPLTSHSLKSHCTTPCSLVSSHKYTLEQVVSLSAEHLREKTRHTEENTEGEEREGRCRRWWSHLKCWGFTIINEFPPCCAINDLTSHAAAVN